MMRFRAAINSKVIKYGIFGIASAAIEFCVFLLLVGFAYIYVASTVSFLAGLISSFIFNKFIVFKNSKKITAKETLQFFTLGAVNSQLSSVVTTSLSWLLPGYVAKVITMAVIAGWNYLIMGRLIFKSERQNEARE